MKRRLLRLIVLSLLFIFVVAIGIFAVLPDAIYAERVPNGVPNVDYGDLIVGVPGEDLEGVSGAGGVNVHYGNEVGFWNFDFWYQQGSGSVPGVPQAVDGFGESLASGDLNGDGYPDLIVGVPFENSVQGAGGGMQIMYGEPNNGNWVFAPDPAGWFDQNTPDLFGVVEFGDNFGTAVTAGDFNGDGYDDLVAGVPGEDFGAVDNGGIHVLYGSGSGPTTAGSQWFNHDSPGIEGVSQNDNKFGSALATGDFNSDGYDDLAVGVTGYKIVNPDLTYKDDAGAVLILYGSTNGLSANGSWTISKATATGSDQAYALFGFALATGDLNGDGYDDLAASATGFGIGSETNVGAVGVFFGSQNGLLGSGVSWLHQDSPHVAGAAEKSDIFGHSLAVGDFNHDGRGDLAVGVPGEGNSSGIVEILYGPVDQLQINGSQLFSQATVGVFGSAESGDLFGFSLAAGDLDNDGYDDLAVGVPYEDIGNIADAGGVNVLYGSTAGLVGGYGVWLDQSSPNVFGSAETFDIYGRALLIIPPPLHYLYIPVVEK